MNTIHSEEYIRLWTIQPEDVWEKLRLTGKMYVQPSLVEGLSLWPSNYDWMKRQLIQYLPDYKGHYPWWAWLQPKPDLRKWSWRSFHNGERQVRIELVLPKERVLISNFAAWEMALNHGYVGLTATEQQEWDTELAANKIDDTREPLPEPWEARLINSWKNIFDLRAIEAGEFWSTDQLQATFEQLDVGEVRDVTPFKARL